MSLQHFFYAPLTAGTHQVGLAGDFSAWKIIPMPEENGIFRYSLDLPRGKYLYKFIVDGVWLADAANPHKVTDPYGGHNSLLLVEDETPVQMGWEELLELVQHNQPESFIQVIRSGEGKCELRFSWPVGMADAVELVLSDQRYPMQRVGSTNIADVYHIILHEQGLQKLVPAFDFFISVKYQDKQTVIGQDGLNPDGQGLNPMCCKFAELPIFQVPEWVQDSIIYQIFPDRFCNGDPARNPDFSQWYYFDCKTPPPHGEYLSPEKEYFHLVEDWDDISGLTQSPWQPDGSPDWWSFYGGDIAGVLSKLNYLKELGVNTIYFNPLWQAKSNHKYDSADYHSIDPQFASTEEMISFVQQAHTLGFRIILDVAFNHTGETFWAFRDGVEKGENSAYWNWYDWHKWPLPKPLPADFKPKEYYQCWWGIKDMPDLNYDLARFHPEENEVRDIAEAEPNWPLVDYLVNTVNWWLKEIDIDGFRLDVPDEVPYWFWELFRRQVKSCKPDAWIVGEIWHHAEDWVSARYFDSVMNYACFKNPVLDFFILGRESKDEFIRQIEAGLALYPWHALGAMMNLLGSHDTLRLFTVSKGDISKIRLAALFQMCFVGAPHIYYGDETALPGGKDPDNRRPFNWKYQDNPEAVALHRFYTEITRLRNSHPALRQGSFAFIPGEGELLCFLRDDGSEKIQVYINNTDQDLKFTVQPDWEMVFVTSETRSGILIPKSGIVLRKTEACDPAK